MKPAPVAPAVADREPRHSLHARSLEEHRVSGTLPTTHALELVEEIRSAFTKVTAALLVRPPSPIR